MLEYKEKNVTERVLISPHCLDEIDALHEAIYQHAVAFRTKGKAEKYNTRELWEINMNDKW